MLNEFLKKSRERVGLTQKAAAELIEGVSINTIQNWENGTIPDRTYWPSIINAYDIPQQIFMKEIEKIVFPEVKNKAESQSNFPDFILSESYKKAVLTKEEQELLGIQELYTRRTDDGKNVINYPYGYVDKIGAFNLMNLEESLDFKLGKRDTEFRKFVVQCIKRNPNTVFDINNLSAEDYFKLISCKHYLNLVRFFNNIYQKNPQNAETSLIELELEGDTEYVWRQHFIYSNSRDCFTWINRISNIANLKDFIDVKFLGSINEELLRIGRSDVSYKYFRENTYITLTENALKLLAWHDTIKDKIDFSKYTAKPNEDFDDIFM